MKGPVAPETMFSGPTMRLGIIKSHLFSPRSGDTEFGRDIEHAAWLATENGNIFYGRVGQKRVPGTSGGTHLPRLARVFTLTFIKVDGRYVHESIASFREEWPGQGAEFQVTLQTPFFQKVWS